MRCAPAYRNLIQNFCLMTSALGTTSNASETSSASHCCASSSSCGRSMPSSCSRRRSNHFANCSTWFSNRLRSFGDSSLRSPVPFCLPPFESSPNPASVPGFQSLPSQTLGKRPRRSLQSTVSNPRLARSRGGVVLENERRNALLSNSQEAEEGSRHAKQDTRQGRRQVRQGSRPNQGGRRSAERQ